MSDLKQRIIRQGVEGPQEETGDLQWKTEKYPKASKGIGSVIDWEPELSQRIQPANAEIGKKLWEIKKAYNEIIQDNEGIDAQTLWQAIWEGYKVKEVIPELSQQLEEKNDEQEALSEETQEESEDTALLEDIPKPVFSDEVELRNISGKKYQIYLLVIGVLVIGVLIWKFL